ncbi:Bol1p [Sporobolomyces salmoneus]|uniref:Bol1p n=1 Tax=Sporobolomyces salmoneus TaxID=183962 RepID=UPI0031783C0B
MSSSSSVGPVESSIRSKLQEALNPTVLEITNDSSKHRHHAPMRAVGGGDGESHFTVQIVSDKFEGLRALQRHRLVNDTLKQEFEAGLHALAIKAKSPSEFEASGGSV